MRVVITGATGNVGTSLLRALAREPAVESIVGIARRLPELESPKTTWQAADVARSDLAPAFAGSDAVVHLAWLIQPSRREKITRAVNVEGSRRVFAAAAEAGVKTVVYASSIGAYSPAPKDVLTDESWPTGGIPTSFYSRHKAAVERILDSFQDEHPGIRVVRLRPALIFKRESGSEVRRLFMGPLFPNALARRGLLPFMPAVRGLPFQAVHSYDVGDAYRRALVSDARDAFNIAAEPVLTFDRIADLMGARSISIPPRVLAAVAQTTWRLNLQPTPKGWLDMALYSPVMDTTRARTELGWSPRYSSQEAVSDLFDGIAAGAGLPTPPLAPGGRGPLRLREFATSTKGI